MERLSLLGRASHQLAFACRAVANDTNSSNKTLVLAFFAATQLLIFGACAHDRIAQNDEARLPKGYAERYYEGMRYGLFVPPSYDPNQSYPLIISLHGSTDTVSWDLSWYHDPIQTTAIAIEIPSPLP
ncbi:hypothetical protein HUU05_17570 [candidate division KSB1 bacterium]|nr:hypothetical protein [candidate division KSB1 bacterium]